MSRTLLDNREIAGLRYLSLIPVIQGVICMPLLQPVIIMKVERCDNSRALWQRSRRLYQDFDFDCANKNKKLHLVLSPQLKVCPGLCCLCVCNKEQAHEQSGVECVTH